MTEAVQRFPTVTAICNTYNRCDLLPRVLDSILAQVETFPDFECIVVDDHSDDATYQVLKDYAAKFDAAGVAFTAIGMAENSGAQATPKNRGVEFASGDFVRFLDDDNEWRPGSLKQLVDAAREGDVWPDVVYGRRNYIIDEGCPLEVAAKVCSGESPLVEHDPGRLAEGPMHNYIDTSDALIARGVFWWLIEYTDRMWNESYRRFGDWELFTRMACLDRLVGVTPPRFKALDAVVTDYHWTGKNLQLTRPVNESPKAQRHLDKKAMAQ